MGRPSLWHRRGHAVAGAVSPAGVSEQGRWDNGGTGGGSAPFARLLQQQPQEMNGGSQFANARWVAWIPSGTCKYTPGQTRHGGPCSELTCELTNAPNAPRLPAIRDAVERFLLVGRGAQGGVARPCAGPVRTRAVRSSGRLTAPGDDEGREPWFSGAATKRPRRSSHFNYRTDLRPCRFRLASQ